jgi:ADP-ribose pyrophosphatase
VCSGETGPGAPGFDVPVPLSPLRPDQRTDLPPLTDAHRIRWSEPLPDSNPARRLIFRGRKIDLALQRVDLSDGGHAEREVVIHRGAVALVPMVDEQHVCLIKNHRYAIGKSLLEVPAGTIDPDESPDETARRELLEETGYRAARLEHIREWYVSPGVMTERMHLYLCEDLTPGPADHQADERLETVIVAWTEALAMVEDGRIEDAKTMLALTICDRFKGRSARSSG